MGVKGPNRQMMTGNQAAAIGAKLARVEVVPAYPITPQTQIMEKLIEFIRRGELQARFVPVESEHSAMSVAIAAEAVGARSFTASSSQGIAYMHENLFVAAGLRLPVVMAVVNRGLAMPISIHPDQTDSLAERDSGWIQFYAADAQEVLDLIIQAYRVAEDPRVLLPAAVCLEGFLISHFTEAVEVPPSEGVAEFLGEYCPQHVVLDPRKPMHIGILVNEQYYTEYRYQQKVAMEEARIVIQEVAAKYRATFGRGHGLVETYKVDDAEIVMITMGVLSGLTKLVIDKLRNQGIKVGMIRMVVFRPFPREEVLLLTRSAKKVIVLDRNVSLGSAGILYAEVASALCNLRGDPSVHDVILGLGGRDVNQDDLEKLIKRFSQEDALLAADPIHWLGVRGAS